METNLDPDPYWEQTLNSVINVNGSAKRRLLSYLDRDDKVSAILEEVLRVEGDNAGLVGLGHVRKDRVHHGHEHAILVRVAGILDNWHDVRPLLGHVQQVPRRKSVQ